MAVEQQTAATNEISRNVQDAVLSTDEFTTILQAVTDQTTEVKKISATVLTDADKTTIQIGGLADTMSGVIKSLKQNAEAVEQVSNKTTS